MTRPQLIAGLLASPLIVLGTKVVPAPGAMAGEKTIMFLPGVYRIAPGGQIRIVGANDVYIKGCVFEACATGPADPL